ncbi:hypothetical protein I7I51_08107 [Histoplasma capsulatum]|uniref:Uncharacterized protein n=1 Tax=Ajellomyces capsulatus TaxID=5037 RepID=A0A8A1LWZ8_AJECA|nr:hypothetical protein I7I51_08107 [Histoplasma capsulatum]
MLYISFRQHGTAQKCDDNWSIAWNRLDSNDHLSKSLWVKGAISGVANVKVFHPVQPANLWANSHNLCKGARYKSEDCSSNIQLRRLRLRQRWESAPLRNEVLIFRPLRTFLENPVIYSTRVDRQR